MDTPEIVVYTTQWCGECIFTKRLLKDWAVPFREVDISGDDAACEFVRGATHGYLSVPTLVFPDGRVLVEPSRDALRSAIDAQRTGRPPMGST